MLTVAFMTTVYRNTETGFEFDDIDDDQMPMPEDDFSGGGKDGTIFVVLAIIGSASPSLSKRPLSPSYYLLLLRTHNSTTTNHRMYLLPTTY